MKKLILLLFIPLVAIGQTINQKTYKFVQDPLRPWNKTSISSEFNFDITKINAIWGTSSQRRFHSFTWWRIS